ncbi:HTH_48 domain-containing protein [Trichonephila clavipes]|uniref:HTH_48 domain-containing protein n=1 Tax=Trichonephila clavipes TaxID=2585209 RepID=A0A8X6VT96_TRICX|nr:HTH_48 domain-containing protein [Trichonephila clavipes]
MKCYSELVEAFGNNALPNRTVARWIGKFQQGRVSTRDDQRSGRPVMYGSTWHVPSSSSSWVTLRVMDYIKDLYARVFRSNVLVVVSKWSKSRGYDWCCTDAGSEPCPIKDMPCEDAVER